MCCLLPPEFHQYGTGQSRLLRSLRRDVFADSPISPLTVGVPVPSVEIKLVDGKYSPLALIFFSFSFFADTLSSSPVEEANYFSTSNPPQGEVCIRGPSVTKGYCTSLLSSVSSFDTDFGSCRSCADKNDQVTKETITDDGWLLTGDIGQWNTDG
jgi:long-chain acyl-CoA synthetase